jgi:hypothetical protein
MQMQYIFQVRIYIKKKGGFSEKLQRCLFGDRDEGTSAVLEAIQKKDWVGGSSAGKQILI